MWKKISKNRVKFNHSDDFIVIKPENSEPAIPFFCPECKNKMRNFNDSHAFVKFGVCQNCEIKNGLT